MAVSLGIGIPFYFDGYAVNAFESFSDGETTNLNFHVTVFGGLFWDDTVTFIRTGVQEPFLGL